MPHQLHKPRLRFAFDFEDNFPLEFLQALMSQEEGNEDGGNADRTKPFISDKTGRVENEIPLGQFIV